MATKTGKPEKKADSNRAEGKKPEGKKADASRSEAREARTTGPAPAPNGIDPCVAART